MKGISNGLVFDTETATKVISLVGCTYGDGDVYRTKNGNFFIHNHKIDLDDESISMVTRSGDIEELIQEWKDLDNGIVTVMFNEFELG